MSATRLLGIDDAPRLAELYSDNRAHLAPWEPVREDGFFTVDGQRDLLRRLGDGLQRGSTVPHAILDESGQVVGRITLNDIVRGPFLSCNMGYWLAAAATGRGLATAAVREMAAIAFGPLGLHRIQAGTLPHNRASQRVLERTGFVRFGLAPSYLRIAGRWQDHVLYQLLGPE